VDGTDLYLGSANLTGAGLGAKGAGRRNFELGVSTTDHVLIDAAQRRFDAIWTGRECGACRVRSSCPRPLDAAVTAPTVPDAAAAPRRAKAPTAPGRSTPAARGGSGEGRAPRRAKAAATARPKRAKTKKKSPARRARGA